ncbi:hypothetical protein D3C81_1980400 [compost metagenome]
MAKLFGHLNEEAQTNILISVSKETGKIQTRDDMMEFLSAINGFFVDKRYEFETFISGIQTDKKHMYTLIPVLRGVKNALTGTQSE